MIKLRLVFLLLALCISGFSFAQKRNINKLIAKHVPYPAFAVKRNLEAKVYCSYKVEDNFIKVIDVKSNDPVLSAYVYESLNNVPVSSYKKKAEPDYLVLDFKLK